MQAIARAWRKNRLLTLAFLTLCVITILLILRLGVSFVYWNYHKNEPLKPWMALGYISRSHDVDVERLREAAGIAPDERERRSLEQLSTERGITVEELIARLEAEIAEARSSSPEGADR